MEEMLPEIISSLKDISNLLKKSKIRFSINTEPEMEKIHREQMERFSSSRKSEEPSDLQASTKFSLIDKHIHTFYSAPFSVYYTGKSFRCVPYNHKDGPALQTLSHLMTNKFLHMELREKGGAYGGRAIYNPLCGTLQMMSYRDPQVFRTLETYKNAVDWSEKITETLNISDLNEAKLNIFQVGFL
jgi:Zn-dependent M16 (insulinase) family peptidase